MTIEVIAQTRVEQGTGASRRLRRAGKLPGVLYGHKEAVAITLDHNTIFYALKKEAFHGAVLRLVLDGKAEPVLLRDAQMHPFKPQVLHVDFQRINENEPIETKISLHFLGQDESPAVKLDGALVSHVLTEVEVRALPSKLPAFIEVNLSNIRGGQSVHLSDLVLPEGVELLEVLRGHDGVVAHASGVQGEDETSEEAAAE